MKTLTLAIVAALAVGASAQTRHYTTKDGMITVMPSGETVPTQVIEVVPVPLMPIPVTGTHIITVPESQTRLLNVRYYDTADTSDDLIRVETPRSDYYDVIYTTKQSSVTETNN